MLTKNGYNVIFGILGKSSSVSVKTIAGSSAMLSADTYSSTLDLFNAFSHSLTDGKPYYTGIYFGNGNAAPSVDDYKLSGEFIQGVSYNGVQTSTDFSDEYSGLQATLAVKNNGSSPKTITEIGLFCVYRSNYVFLVDRIVLATPITIPAGGTKSITYNLRHTY